VVKVRIGLNTTWTVDMTWDYDLVHWSEDATWSGESDDYGIKSMFADKGADGLGTRVGRRV
jgi:hypothetical protein